MSRYDLTGPASGCLSDILYFTAPGGGVVAGQGYLIGAMFVVAFESAAAGTTFGAWATGVYKLAKATGQTWSEGQLLYWDNSAKNLTTTSTSNTRVGCAAQAQASGDTAGLARIHGLAAPTGA